MTFAILLPLLITLPFVIGLALFCARTLPPNDQFSDQLAKAGSIALLGFAVVACYQIFSGTIPSETSNSLVWKTPDWLTMPWTEANRASRAPFSLTIDGISGSLVLLTAVVLASVVWMIPATVSHAKAIFSGCLFLSASGLMACFLAADLATFYIGFEVTLLPLLLLITKWGNENARATAFRFLLFTLAGSIPLMVGLIGVAKLYSVDGVATLDMSQLATAAKQSVPADQSDGYRITVFVLILLGFGIKMAILPLHTWLPDTYRNSHPAVTAFMAAVVLKLGLYGMVRILIPLLPIESQLYGPTVIASLGAIAIVAGALIALSQRDLMGLLAYSSLSHVGMVTVGMFSLSEEGVTGAVLQMFNHGVTTAALFLIAGSMLSRRRMVGLDAAGGFASQYPKLSAFFIFFLIAAAGMPGLNNFVGEILALSGMIQKSKVITLVAALGVILGAWYSFELIKDLLYGDIRRQSKGGRVAEGREHPQKSRDGLTGKALDHSKSTRGEIGVALLPVETRDASATEQFIFASLASICLFLGVFPKPAVDVIRQDIQNVQAISPATTTIANELKAGA